jgi:hypothetical protein
MDLSFLLQARLEALQNSIDFLTRRSESTMATLQDVQDKIAAEKAQVSEAMDSLKAQVKALQDQLANGIVVTSEQLDALAAAVDGIFTPDAAPVEPAPEVPVDPVGEPPVEGGAAA